MLGVLVVVLICLALNACLAAYEMAFVAVSRAELRAHAEKGHREAPKLLKQRENPERILSVIQIGITLVGAIAAAVGGAGASEFLAPLLSERYQLEMLTAEIIAIVFIVLPLTYVNVVVGELVPKTLALRYPLKILLGGARILFWSERVLSPVVDLLEKSTQLILNILSPRKHAKGRDADNSEEKPTSIEIEDLSPWHERFMHNLAALEKIKVKNIFLPWEKVIYVNDEDSLEHVAHTVILSGHTRLPVLHSGKVIGILNTKEFMTLKESGETNWYGIVRPFLSASPSQSALKLLRLMQEKRKHMAIVLSTNGETIGLVTMENILEQVVGDIFDEDDDGHIRGLFRKYWKQKSPGSFRQMPVSQSFEFKRDRNF